MLLSKFRTRISIDVVQYIKQISKTHILKGDEYYCIIIFTLMKVSMTER